MRSVERLSFLLTALVLFTGIAAAESGMMPETSSLENARKRMVERQLRSRGIRDERLLAAFLRVERHRFVPPDLAALAYGDSPLPIGEGQTISQPYVVAFMTDILRLTPADRVLEIGTGSGYQAAILGELAGEVFSIEIAAPLGTGAASLLRDLGYKNVSVKIGDGYQGWPEHAPFDAIIVTCSPSHIPKPLQEQLAEGGRMIIPVGEGYNQELVFVRKRDGKLNTEVVLPVRFVPMTGPGGKKY